MEPRKVERMIQEIPGVVLQGMRDRAWIDAVRCWSEYRSGDPEVRSLLLASAREAEGWWRILSREVDRRG